MNLSSNSNALRPYDLLIFDWDGTLMDSTATIAACIQAACVAVGQPKPDIEKCKYVIGLGLMDALRHVAPKCPEDLYPELGRHYRMNYLAGDMHLQLFDGVAVMLASFAEAGYTLAIATGKNRAGLDRVLKNTGIGGFFAATRGADEALPKPDGLMVKQILEELNFAPHRALVIGDTTHDIGMAHHAGVGALALVQGAHSADELTAANPLAVLSSISLMPAWLKERSLAKLAKLKTEQSEG